MYMILPILETNQDKHVNLTSPAQKLNLFIVPHYLGAWPRHAPEITTTSNITLPKPNSDHTDIPDTYHLTTTPPQRLQPPLAPDHNPPQIELWTKAYPPGVHLLPRTQDEEVARCHLEKLGIRLDTLSPEQAEYINVSTNGPYKPDYYRYWVGEIL